jgi:hypothetical protein
MILNFSSEIQHSALQVAIFKGVKIQFSEKSIVLNETG